MYYDVISQLIAMGMQFTHTLTQTLVMYVHLITVIINIIQTRTYHQNTVLLHAIAIRYHLLECCQGGVDLQCVSNRTPSISAKLIIPKTTQQ